MTVINHPMWYEDPWEIELSEVATLSRDGYHYDDTPPGQLADGTSTEGKEDGGWSFVEVIGNLLETVANGVAGALRGVGEVVGTVWEIIVGGAQALIGGFASFLGNLFGGAEPLPPILNPIETNLEAALQPFFDRMDELGQENETKGQEIDALREENRVIREDQGRTLEDMESLRSQLSDKVDQASFNNAQERAAQALQTAMDDLQKASDAMREELDAELRAITEKQSAASDEMRDLKTDLAGKTGLFNALFEDINSARSGAIEEAATDAQKRADQALADAKVLIDTAKSDAATDATNKANKALDDAVAAAEGQVEPVQQEVDAAQNAILDIHAGRFEETSELFSIQQDAIQANTDLLKIHNGQFEQNWALWTMQDELNTINEAMWESQLDWNTLQEEWNEGLNKWRENKDAIDQAQNAVLEAQNDILYGIRPPRQLLPMSGQTLDGVDLPNWAAGGLTTDGVAVSTYSKSPGEIRPRLVASSSANVSPSSSATVELDKVKHPDNVYRWEFDYYAAQSGTALVIYLNSNIGTSGNVEWNNPNFTEETKDVSYSGNHQDHLFWASNIPAGTTTFSGTIKFVDEVTRIGTSTVYLRHSSGSQNGSVQLRDLRLFPSIVTQDEVNRLNEALWDQNREMWEKQRAIDANQDKMAELTQEMAENNTARADELQRAMEVQAEFTTRAMYRAGGSAYQSPPVWDDFLEMSPSGTDLKVVARTAVKNWTGHIIIHGAQEDRIDGVDQVYPLTRFIDVKPGNQSTDRTYTFGRKAGLHNATATFWVKNAEFQSRKYSGGYSSPSEGSWYIHRSIPVSEAGEYSIRFDILWNAATYLDTYGIRIRHSSRGVLGTERLKNNVGPLTPLGNGRIAWDRYVSGVNLTGGTIYLETYRQRANPSYAMADLERAIASYSADVSWMPDE